MVDEKNIELSSRERLDFYSQRLGFLWGRYTNFLHLIISLAGATILIFFNSIGLKDLGRYAHSYYFILAIGCAALSLVVSIFWRLTTQYFMEKETLGNGEEASLYFEENHIDHVTTTYKSLGKTGLLRFVHKACFLISIVSLVTSWAFLLLLALSAK